jgi:N-acetylglucosaminyldiphosphoundecaprenol N-acetyl-beta-D-mannosaminyltransferase
MAEICFMGIRVDVIDRPQLLDAIDHLAAAQRPALVNNVNVQACNLAWADAEFRQILNESEIVFCDGFGVKLGARLLGLRLGERLTPPDWIDDLFQRCVRRRYTVFFVGDTDAVVNLFARRVAHKHPELRVVGWHHGYFMPGADEEARLIRELNRLRPDVILTGMGMPLQEKWAWRARRQLARGVVVSTGALFRWYTGTERRAPHWVTGNGLEWLARLLVAPRRHFRRYVIGLPLFFWRVLCVRFGKGVS